jgi:ribosomal protein S18 acetylase RimI-like enzyme
MLRFRTFRNGDPPALAAIWNEAATGRGAAAVANAAEFERAVYAKPYFDPAGLIVADDEGTPIGFVHAGFGPNDDETAIDPSRGVICAIAVRMAHRRRGIGTELLRRAERYLTENGSEQVVAGPKQPRNPFYFGLYGGSDLCGFLESDPLAEQFLTRRGFRFDQSTLVLERRLRRKVAAPDSRFADLRRRFELEFFPAAQINSWWQDCVLGLTEPSEFRLVDRHTGQPAARTVVWEMEDYEEKRTCPAAGILEFFVRSDLRRQGVGRFLIVQTLRAIQEREFGLAEVQCSEENEPAVEFLRGLGFEPVDCGRTYGKALIKADSRRG